jgi:class 3 adenylate cyclase
MTTSTMAVVFCDVVSSTEVRDRLGDTRADTWFGDLLRHIGGAVVEANGSVVKSLGDGVMAVFTSAGAALDAAVAMQRAAVSHGWRYPSETARVRVGISIGDVSSSNDDGTDDWNGMPVVEAARLCAAAEPEEILAAEVVRVLVGSRTDHQMTPVGDYSLKGRSAPMAVVRVGWDRPAARPSDRASVTAFPDPLNAVRRGPFVGRAALIAELLDTWKSEEWRTLLVAGEPGIGKTRFVSELALLMSDADTAVLLGRCDEDLAVAFRPWAEALAPLIDSRSDADLAELAPEHLQELAAIVPALRRRVGHRHAIVELDAPTRLSLLRDAISALLRRSAPVVLVLDDIHWIDQASLVALRHVVAQSAPGVTIIGTYRDTDLDRVHPLSAALADLRQVDDVRRVVLDGLDETSVSEFFRAYAGHDLDEAARSLADAVHSQTSGNPLFVGEVIRHLAETGAIVQEGNHWRTGSSVTGTTLPEGHRRRYHARV